MENKGKAPLVMGRGVQSSSQDRRKRNVAAVGGLPAPRHTDIPDPGAATRGHREAEGEATWCESRLRSCPRPPATLPFSWHRRQPGTERKSLVRSRRPLSGLRGEKGLVRVGRAGERSPCLPRSTSQPEETHSDRAGPVGHLDL